MSGERTTAPAVSGSPMRQPGPAGLMGSRPPRAERNAPLDEVVGYAAPDLEAGASDRHAEALGIDLEPWHSGAQHVIAQVLQRYPGVGGRVRPGNAAVQQHRPPGGRSRTETTSVISSRTGVVRLIS